MNMRTLLVALAYLATFAVYAAAGPEDIRRAAERGDAEQQVELGTLYEYGFGLSKNKNQVPALTWYILAAEQGNAKAIKRRDDLKGRMTAEQVAEAQRQADELRKNIAQARAAEKSAPSSAAPVVPVAAPVDAAPAGPAASPATDTTPAPANGETVPVSVPAESAAADAVPAAPFATPATNTAAGVAKGEAVPVSVPAASPGSAPAPAKGDAPSSNP